MTDSCKFWVPLLLYALTTCALLLQPADTTAAGDAAANRPPELDPLIRTLSSAQASSNEKLQASDLLRAQGDRAVRPLLDVLHASDTNSAWFYSIRALGYLKNPIATEDLYKVLQNKSYGSRRYAAIALGQIGDPRAVDALARALGDVNYVQRDALDALARIDDPKAIRVLEDYYYGGTTPAVHLEITCDKREYSLGDAIRIDALLQNQSDRAFELPPEREGRFGNLLFQTQTGRFVEVVQSGIADLEGMGASPKLQMTPGGSLRCQLTGRVMEWTAGEKDDHKFVPTGHPFLTLAFGNHAYHIRRSGAFQARLVVRNAPLKAASNPVPFSIKMSSK